MKGTVKRGMNIHEDEEYAAFLRNDEKNQSENVMIVDLLRNDIGRVSREGSVRVTKLYEIEKYNTLFQMTSTVKSRLSEGISTHELIKSIFPSGSVTGAPKIRSMEIIHELEKEERKIYTGSIGFFSPSGESKFNVAIRTLLIKDGRGEMGIGGGIVYDSQPDSEFFEAKLKGNFLVQRPVGDFQLIETIFYDGQFRNIALHLKRLQESALYFDFEFDVNFLMKELEELSASLGEERRRVRVLLHSTGELEITHTVPEAPPEKFKIAVSGKRTDSGNVFLYHKTTNRALYTDELARAKELGFFDVIFLNERGEITEGARTNIYFKKNGILHTPPVKCGLLGGTFREYMLRENKARESIITSDEIKASKEVFISNALIGLRKAALRVP